MNRFLRISMLAPLLLAAPLAAAQAMESVAPQNVKVLLENDRVRVLEVRAWRGDKIGMHSHPAHVVYGLLGGKAVFTMPDGRTRNAELKTGQVLYIEPISHAQEHSTDAHVIIVEMKN